ncbi:MAG TPA: kelch repeat-containing protein, partial [Candidatus Acidoferrales bacterium]|nr:kelch repeat-containing protein [Candidatus Acidoferrales bacterium]
DPVQNIWTPTDPSPKPRPRPTITSGNERASLAAGGRVLVVGGELGNDLVAGADLYDPATNSWLSAGSLSAPRWLHTATALANGLVLVTGGAGPDKRGSYLASAEIWSP